MLGSGSLAGGWVGRSVRRLFGWLHRQQPPDLALGLPVSSDWVGVGNCSGLVWLRGLSHKETIHLVGSDSYFDTYPHSFLSSELKCLDVSHSRRLQVYAKGTLLGCFQGSQKDANQFLGLSTLEHTPNSGTFVVQMSLILVSVIPVTDPQAYSLSSVSESCLF